RYPRARTDLRFHSAAGGLALHDGSGPRAEHLDFAAALVLTYCDGQHDPGSIAEAVAGSLSHTDRDALRADVRRIIEAFASEGLIVV
ncbi:MAG TPA: PqqD family protein, partial [Gemmatimonadales bacterium]|nr:PqqD family protein [Gemmatimonadales bacterium]